MRKVCVLVVFLIATGALQASSFLLTGPATFSGQGFGTLYTILSLHNNGTETGAVAPTIASNLSALDSSFGGCSGSGGTDLCGDATNQSAVITAANLASLSFTSASTFGLLYNVNQQGSDLNTYLYAPTPFTVYFYDSTGGALFSASYAGTSTPFPPAELNGQGTAGWLFTLTGQDFANSFTSIAYIGMSGTVANANDGADDWCVVNAEGGGGGADVPEPVGLMLAGGGLIGLAVLKRRRRQ